MEKQTPSWVSRLTDFRKLLGECSATIVSGEKLASVFAIVVLTYDFHRMDTGNSGKGVTLDSCTDIFRLRLQAVFNGTVPNNQIDNYVRRIQDRFLHKDSARMSDYRLAKKKEADEREEEHAKVVRELDAAKEASFKSRFQALERDTASLHSRLAEKDATIAFLKSLLLKGSKRNRSQSRSRSRSRS
eukprot:GILI01013406.1.p1 GENE.GILI01013406.1~~GILI01013406.1.p1  ORF type:complete len:187 (-),score=20.26 GILI01013406.1:99-659(-)